MKKKSISSLQTHLKELVHEGINRLFTEKFYKQYLLLTSSMHFIYNIEHFIPIVQYHGDGQFFIRVNTSDQSWKVGFAFLHYNVQIAFSILIN